MEVVVGRCFEKRSGEFLVWMSVQIVCIKLVSTKLNIQLSLAKINSTEPSNILSPILSRYSCFLAIHHIEDAGNGLFVVLKLTWKVLLTTLLNSIGGTRVSTLNGVLGECSDRGSIYIFWMKSFNPNSTYSWEARISYSKLFTGLVVWTKTTMSNQRWWATPLKILENNQIR